MTITGRKLTALECAIEDAATFHNGMAVELARLAEEADRTGNYSKYDETAADMREEAEGFLTTIIAAYEAGQGSDTPHDTQ
jgi:hypothetical protein